MVRIKHRSVIEWSRWRSAALALGLAAVSMSCAAIDASANAAAVPASAASDALPYRPKPGDKLGYSKEESTARLEPQVRQLLDAVLRLYREPGLFTNRKAAFALLGASVGERYVFKPPTRYPGESTRFRDTFARQGIFARPAWQGQYEFTGWTRPEGEAWRAEIQILVDRKIECHSSRAVEGYLDLFLYSGLDGFPHPLPARLWDRHGVSGSPYAKPLGPLMPGVELGFVSGCLVRISIGGLFNYKDVSDDHVLN